jgi:hypothetical protein
MDKKEQETAEESGLVDGRRDVVYRDCGGGDGVSQCTDDLLLEPTARAEAGPRARMGVGGPSPFNGQLLIETDKGGQLCFSWLGFDSYHQLMHAVDMGYEHLCKGRRRRATYSRPGLKGTIEFLPNQHIDLADMDLDA